MKKCLVVCLALVMALAFLPLGAQAAKLSEDTLAKKKEGWYPTGLPLVNFSSDDGFGYGARVYMYYNGAKEDTYFDSAPYFMQLYAQYYATTNGVNYHELNLDMPYIAGSKFRIKSAIVLNRDRNANYFGRGADAAQEKILNPLDTTTTYSNYSDYQKFIDDNEGYMKFYKYDINKPKYYFYLFRDVTDSLKIMLGGEFKKIGIHSWKGESGKEVDDNLQIDTLLNQENPLGFEGGWTNYARAGIGYDTRDFEPDPKKGYYLDYCFEISDGAIGSDYDFTKHNAQAMLFVSPINPLTFAFRMGYTTAANDIPFYEQDWFGFALERRQGLGGNRTLLGYKKGRFAGKTMTVGNVEARWQFAEASGAGQHFGFKLIGLAAAGNVFDEAADPFTDPRFDEYFTTFGGGFAIAWNLNTIVHFLYGVSKEDTGISIDFNYTF